MIRKLSFTAPFLVAIFTVVTLYQANAERIDPGSMIMPAILGLGIAGLFLILFSLLQVTSPAAPLVASGFTFVTLEYHLIPWYADVLILVGITALGILKYKYKRLQVDESTFFFNILLVVAIIFSGVQAARISINKPESTSSGVFINKPNQANIYFIVPDRCPSPAAMREAGIDPDPTLADLRDLGFYIDENKMSEDPYTLDWPDKIYTTRTMRYFASVLNGGIYIPMDITYQDCRTMIQDNAVFTWLHGKGYTITNIPSWFTETQKFTDQDYVYPFTDVTLLERFFLDELGEAYFSRTILNGFNFRVFESFGSQTRIEKERLAWQEGHILNTEANSSSFVISHLTLPHEPYIYGDPKDPIPEQYYANIRAALMYLDELAGEIRARDPEATIIIQSDEGMAYRKPADLNLDLSKTEWSGVFSAWYCPEIKTALDPVKHTEVLDLVINH